MLVNFISHAVVLGFAVGAALLIATNQLKHFFGVEEPRKLNNLERITLFFDKLDEVNLYAALVRTVTLTAGLVLARRNDIGRKNTRVRWVTTTFLPRCSRRQTY